MFRRTVHLIGGAALLLLSAGLGRHAATFALLSDSHAATMTAGAAVWESLPEQLEEAAGDPSGALGLEVAPPDDDVASDADAAADDSASIEEEDSTPPADGQADATSGEASDLGEGQPTDDPLPDTADSSAGDGGPTPSTDPASDETESPPPADPTAVEAPEPVGPAEEPDASPSSCASSSGGDHDDGAAPAVEPCTSPETGPDQPVTTDALSPSCEIGPTEADAPGCTGTDDGE